MSRIEEQLRALVRDEVSRVLAERRVGGDAGTDQLLTVREAGEQARLSPGHIRRLIRNGRLPARGEGRMMRIARADLDEFLGERRRRGLKSDPSARARRDFGSGR